MNKCRALSLSYFFALCVAFILAFQFLALRIPSHALMPSILFEFVQPLLKLRFLSRALFANRLFLFRYATTLLSPPPLRSPPQLLVTRVRRRQGQEAERQQQGDASQRAAGQGSEGSDASERWGGRGGRKARGR